MTPKKFIFIAFLTIIFYFLLRFIGWEFFSQTKLWQRIINDNLHHYQLGTLLLLVAFIFLKRKPTLKDYFLAIGSGMIIDESAFIFKIINRDLFDLVWSSNPILIFWDLSVFIIFSIIIFKFKKR